MVSVRLSELSTLAGTRLGVSGWHAVTRAQVEAFADASGDRQWIHLDEERAADGPFGCTVVQGYLTLAIGPELLGEIVEVTDASAVLNYGLDRVRFPAPVPVGARIRTLADLVSTRTVRGGVQAHFALTVEVEDSARPACVAEVIFRYLP